MNRRLCLAARGILLGPLLTLALGCATLNVPAPMAKTLGGPKQQRNAEVHRQFDENRDAAEFQSAYESFSQGNAKACEESLGRLLKRNPKHRDARLLMIDVCLAGRRVPEAFEHAHKALQAYPQDAQVQHAMGLLLDVADRKAEALAYYERAAKWEPDNEVFTVGYQTALAAGGQPGVATVESTGPAGTAVPAAAAGSPPPAEVVANNPPALEAPKSNAVRPTDGRPEDRSSRLAQGDASHPRANKLISPEAARFAETNGAADPAAGHGVAGLLAQGGAALKADDPAAALRCYREAAATKPDDPQILLSAAAGALRLNRPDVVVELLAPVEKRFSTSAPLQRALGAAYYRLGDYHAAEVALRQALSLDKSSALAYFLMGCTLAKRGQSASAEEHLRQAQMIDPRYTLRR